MRLFTALLLSAANRRTAALGLLLAGLAATTACDIIDQPVPPSATITAGRRDTLSLDSAELRLPATPLVKKVLLEDFTGQFCGNCPAAARQAATLQQQQPERLVVMGIHLVDYFAAPKTYAPFQADLRVPNVSSELENAFGIAALPAGTVDRVPRSGSSTVLSSFSDWPALVNNELAQPATHEIKLTTLYNATTRRLRLKAHTRYLNASATRRFRLVLMVTQDSLKGGQKDYALPAGQQDISSYMHRHVLRAALLGTFGQLDVAAPTAGQERATYLSYDLPTAWDDKHCALVGYLMDDASKEVVQVQEVKIRR